MSSFKIHRNSASCTRYLQQQQKYTHVYKKRGEQHPEREGETGKYYSNLFASIWWVSVL